MNKIFKFAVFAILAVLTAACAKDEPFIAGEEAGQLSVKKMIVKIDNEENVVRSSIDVGSFIVDICKPDGEVVDTYIYADMPEVVTLPVGSYFVKVRSGELQTVAWEAPYFEGREEFEVKSREITEVSTVVCKLANVRVTIIFDQALKDGMSADSHVNVVMGQNATIDFAKDETRSAYFAYVEGSNTLVATFKGTVHNGQSEEFKAYTDVKPGNHYKITYSYHQGGLPGDEGDLVFSGVLVDASVEEESLVINVDAGDDDLLEDDMRPNGGGDEPTPPGPGPEPGDEGPKIVIPDGSAISFDGIVDIVDGDTYKVVVNSETGFTEFKVVIESNYLTDEFLADVGMTTQLDLVNPGDSKEGLASLGLPVEVGGKKSVEFDISQLVPLLALDEVSEVHSFIMTVSDASGKTVKTLKFRNL